MQSCIAQYLNNFCAICDSQYSKFLLSFTRSRVSDFRKFFQVFCGDCVSSLAPDCISCGRGRGGGGRKTSVRMRREGRLGGKPTNHSRMAGKCRVVNCEQCHESLPLNKSRGKGKGRIKRLVSDIPSTHLLSDWRVSQPSRNVLQKWDPDTEDDDEEEAADGYDGGKEPEGWALSISLLLDTALEHIQESVDARCRKAEEERGLTTATQLAETDDEGDVPDLEAFKNEFDVFKYEIEAGGSPASVGESADSWSGIEISDADDSDLGEWEDDWSLVGDEIAG